MIKKKLHLISLEGQPSTSDMSLWVTKLLKKEATLNLNENFSMRNYNFNIVFLYNTLPHLALTKNQNIK